MKEKWGIRTNESRYGSVISYWARSLPRAIWPIRFWHGLEKILRRRRKDILEFHESLLNKSPFDLLSLMEQQWARLWARKDIEHLWDGLFIFRDGMITNSNTTWGFSNSYTSTRITTKGFLPGYPGMNVIRTA